MKRTHICWEGRSLSLRAVWLKDRDMFRWWWPVPSTGASSARPRRQPTHEYKKSNESLSEFHYNPIEVFLFVFLFLFLFLYLSLSPFLSLSIYLMFFLPLPLPFVSYSLLLALLVKIPSRIYRFTISLLWSREAGVNVEFVMLIGIVSRFSGAPSFARFGSAMYTYIHTYIHIFIYKEQMNPSTIVGMATMPISMDYGESDGAHSIIF